MMTLHELWDICEHCKCFSDDLHRITLRWAASQIEAGNYQRGAEFPPRRQPTIWERIVAFLEV